MVYSLNFDDKRFYGQIIESKETNFCKALLYRREVYIKGSRLKLIARTYAQSFMDAVSLLDLFVENEKGGES